jgi:uncharacterized protein (TIGR03437 family)
MIVALSSNNANATVPATVTVAAGAAAGVFTATVGSITANQNATITASASGTSQTFALGLVLPLQISSLACSPTTVAALQIATCTVTLNQPALSGVTVTLSSNSTTLTVPPNLTIAGASSGTFTATAGAVSSSQTATITAALSVTGGKTTLAAAFGTNTTLTLVPASTQSGVTCNPASVTAPGSATCTVTVGAAAPAGGLPVYLSSNNGNANTPANLIIPAGGVSGSFAVSVVGSITANQTATITATAKGVSRTFLISMIAPRLTISGAIIPASLGSGATVLLSGTANAIVTADAAGNFSFGGLPNGSYTVIPSRTGVTFSPAKKWVSVNGANVPGIAFTGATVHNNSGPVVRSGIQSITQAQTAAATFVTMASPATGIAGKTCSPGGLVTISGTGFTDQDPQSAASYPLPAALGGVQVQVNGKAVPLLLVSASQINFQCPLLASGSSLDIAVIAADGTVAATTQSIMAAAAPDLFTVNGTTQGVILIASKNEMAMTQTPGLAGSPAQPGDVLSIYASGLGETQAPVAIGTPAPSTPPVPLKNKIAIFVSGVEIDPALSILAPGTAGLDQVNVQLPVDVAVGSAIPLYLQVTLADGTVIRSNTVTLAIDPAGR